MCAGQMETEEDAAQAQGPQRDELVSQLKAGTVPLSDTRSVCEQLGLTPSAKDHGHVGGLLAGKIGKNRFVVRSPNDIQSRHAQADYAIDGRSKCRYSKCGAFIVQSDLRIGKIPPAIKCVGRR